VALENREGANVVIAASDEPLNADRLTASIAGRGGEEQVLVGAAAEAFAGGMAALTDDRAPVDQWLARARRSPRGRES